MKHVEVGDYIYHTYNGVPRTDRVVLSPSRAKGISVTVYTGPKPTVKQVIFVHIDYLNIHEVVSPTAHWVPRIFTIAVAFVAFTYLYTWVLKGVTQ